ncbi:hypothetical protein ACFCZ6_03680 [Streptomyces hydrogenans]|uniref:hypothetical protein n=1 Tax=Streptomyces hydrogenans TaxID=1873719 RepID=UPI0035D8789D
MSTAVTLLVALAGCTAGPERPRGSAKPGAAEPSAAERPSVTQRPYDKTPARPLGQAAVDAQDHAFLRTAFAVRLPAGHRIPRVDEVVVIHRLDDENGELAWMSDGRTFCYGKIRKGYSSYRCGRLPEKPPAPGLLLTLPPEHDRVTGDDDLDRVRNINFVMAEGGPERFDHVKRSQGMGPVHQAVARFPSGRMVTFLTFDHPGHGWQLDPKAEICRSDRAVCFPSEPVPY